MGLPNLKLRGGSYHWRRKIMVAGRPLPLSISLRTGNFYRARAICARLSVAVEGLRMAYGQFTGVSREQMKKVRPLLPVLPLLAEWLQAEWDRYDELPEEERVGRGYLVNYYGRPVRNVARAWDTMLDELGCSDDLII